MAAARLAVSQRPHDAAAEGEDAMSGHAAFRRQPVPGEMVLRHQTATLPAPIRGIVETENWAYTKPGCATVIDNWYPTQKGLRIRGGTERWCVLPDPVEAIRSGFEYVSGAVQRMFVSTNFRLFDVTFADTPVLQTGIGSIGDGNFTTAQFATAGGDWLLAVNDTGDYVRRFNGTIWEYLDTAFAGTPGRIKAVGATDPANVKDGKGLTHVWKYRNRLFFIQGGTMNAWCLPVNAVAGDLIYIPLSGAAKRGGSLLFGASWSVDSGDNSDDKCCFFTDQGEVLVFTGTNPELAANWQQHGRYDISKPFGKNGHQQLGGDVLVITVDGIVPLSAAVAKDVSALSLAAITYNIEPTWMREFRRKNFYPWTIAKWDEGDLMFVTFPGGKSYKNHTVGVSNLHTGAWSRYVGWDAMCFMQINGRLFFGTQDGKVMLAESTGFDDAHDNVEGDRVGNSYACTMVGGWEMFQTPPSQVTWLQARAAFFSAAREPFEPQLAATVDYEFRIPPPPNVGPDPGPLDVWDQGVWGPSPVAHPPTPAEMDAYAQWDQPAAGNPAVRNTMWVSIGETGFSHAPICQVSIGQQFKPDVELISISATFVRMGANV